MNFIIYFIICTLYCNVFATSDEDHDDEIHPDHEKDTDSSESAGIPYTKYNRSAKRYPPKTQIAKSISDFKALTQCSSFVDKTMLIKSFLENDKNLGEDTFHLVTCPRRFGKSTNLDMIKRFISIQVNETTGEILDKTTHENYKLFMDETLKLKISEDKDFLEKHLMKYPVIFIDFIHVNPLDQKEMVIQMKSRLLDVLHSYSWLDKFINKTELVKTPTDNVPDNVPDDVRYKYLNYRRGFDENSYVIYMAQSFRRLTEYLYEYFGKKKVIVLIDGYDKPIHKLISNGEPANGIMHNIGLVVSQLIKGGTFVSHALVTGVSGAIVQTDSSDLTRPNLCHWRFLDDHIFAQYYGFTEAEVMQLLVEHDIDEEEAEGVKDFYNGYKIRHTGEVIYNPLSVVTYLSRRILRSYWLETGTILSIKPFLMQNEFRKHIVELLLGGKESCINMKEVCNIKELEDLYKISQNMSLEIENSHVKSYFSYFFEQGYLSHASTDGYFTIPNKEIELEFGDILELYYSDQHKDDLNTVGNFLSNIVENENVTDNMISILQKSLERLFELTYDEYRSNTNKMFANEFDYHAQIYAAAKLFYGDYVSGERWMRKLPRPGRRKMRFGRPDISIMSKSNGLVIVEVKHRKTAKIALQQAQQYRPQKSMKPNFMKFIGINIRDNRSVEIDVAPRFINISAVEDWEHVFYEKKPRVKRNKTKHISKKTKLLIPFNGINIKQVNVSAQNMSVNINVDFRLAH